jgi:hypothetical protein
MVSLKSGTHVSTPNNKITDLSTLHSRSGETSWKSKRKLNPIQIHITTHTLTKSAACPQSITINSTALAIRPSKKTPTLQTLTKSTTSTQFIMDSTTTSIRASENTPTLSSPTSPRCRPPLCQTKEGKARTRAQKSAPVGHKFRGLSRFPQQTLRCASEENSKRGGGRACQK